MPFAVIYIIGGDVSFTESVNEETLPAKLQRKLEEDGIPFRDGGRDITWKYQNYPKSVQKEKVPCLGLPVRQLLRSWETHKIPIGSAVEQLLKPDCDANSPNA